MKRISFFLCFLTLGICGNMTSCTNEELVLQYSPQAQRLLDKGREFALKYGVDMWLNEEHIEETAKFLTVEKMEEDFKREANRKKEAITRFSNRGLVKNKMVRVIQIDSIGPDSVRRDTLTFYPSLTNDSIRTDSVK
ncbi:MAG: hypothetical protein IKT26_01635 [Bacteroidaceae bacterium]|nr:hypothetical protein [Bacteroidaceae bacterium]